MRRAGFSFLEVVVASAILVVVITFSLGVLSDTDRSVGESLRLDDLVNQANLTGEQISRELRSAGRLLLDAAPGKRLTYSPVTGYDFARGAPRYGPARQLRFARTEADDGLDNDRDGLIDEGDLVLLRDSDGDGVPDEQIAVLARGVSEGLAISFPGGGTAPLPADSEVRIDFAIQGRLPRTGAVHTEPRQLRLGLRNRD